MDFELIQRQFLDVVDNQLKANNPKETRQTLERLRALGYSELESKMLIAQCVAAEMYAVFHSNAPYDEARYIATLHQLPTSPATEVEE
jgi:hypothetical protein